MKFCRECSKALYPGEKKMCRKCEQLIYDKFFKPKEEDERVHLCDTKSKERRVDLPE